MPLNKGGKSRKGKIKTCEACSKEFYVPQYRIVTAKFCSLFCQNVKQYQRTVFVCKVCGDQFSDSPSRKDRIYCSQDCKTKDSIGEKERRKRIRILRVKKLGHNSSRAMRRWIWEFKEKKCEICDYSEKVYCLDIHHLDKNPTNNKVENLVVLCCMCHRKLHKGDIVYAPKMRKEQRDCIGEYSKT